MKRYIVTLLLASVALFSCEKYETIKTVDTDFKNNYEFFWNLVDEQYCYLDYKNIDWEGVKQEMMPRVEAAKNEFEFFKVLTESLDYLRDGHVGLITPFNRYGCSTYLNDENGVPYPSNFESSARVRQYLVGNDLYSPMVLLRMATAPMPISCMISSLPHGLTWSISTLVLLLLLPMV